MKRSSFLKSILTIIACPKILIEASNQIQKINIISLSSTSGFFNDLNLLFPDYYEGFIKKYGSENYTSLIEQINQPS